MFFYVSKMVKGIENWDEIKRDFKDLFGHEWEDFRLLDLANIITLISRHHAYENPSKYFLYSDSFFGNA